MKKIKELKKSFGPEKWRIVWRIVVAFVSFGIFEVGLNIPYGLGANILMWCGFIGMAVFGGMVFLECLMRLQGIWTESEDLDE